MSKTTTIDVWKAYHGDRLSQIALSEVQLRRLCPECTLPGWSIKHSTQRVGEAQGTVINWSERGGCGGDHVHWECPFCGEEHICDFEPHTDSNPALWFCDRGNDDDMCLVKWCRES